MWTFIHIFDYLLWIFMAASVIYVFFYAFVSLFHHSQKEPSIFAHHHSTFLILFPAYQEDAVIVHSIRQFLEQTYPSSLYQIVVISDQMKDTTNDQLKPLPIILHTPVFEKSSKAKALQYAIAHTQKEYDYIVVMDADNVVSSDFLEQLNVSCQQGYQAIQCHRCAKNSNNDVAILDGASEEINNTIFRKAHNTIGLSSALIGSGMCFNYGWFKKHVYLLNTAVEDRELEAILMKQHVFIKYEENIHVFDEKVSDQNTFQRQRLRWMNGQIQTLLYMLPYIPKAIITGNLNYIDKTIQQALIPRSILIVSIACISVLLTIFTPTQCVKWWVLLALLSAALFISLPAPLRACSISKVLTLPVLTWKMLKNILNINHKNTDFIHTTHTS